MTEPNSDRLRAGRLYASTFTIWHLAAVGRRFK